MKFFLDTEFMEDGSVILPISIAAVTDTGEAFYGVFTDADYSQANEWVKENVIPYVYDFPVGLRQQVPNLTECHAEASVIAREFREWVYSFSGTPEFWASHGAYDWVMVCQMYGPMIDLPHGWPMFIRDVQQMRTSRRGWLPTPEYPHHPLSDALCVRERYEYLTDLHSS